MYTTTLPLHNADSSNVQCKNLKTSIPHHGDHQAIPTTPVSKLTTVMVVNGCISNIPDNMSTMIWVGEWLVYLPHRQYLILMRQRPSCNKNCWQPLQCIIAQQSLRPGRCFTSFQQCCPKKRRRVEETSAKAKENGNLWVLRSHFYYWLLLGVSYGVWPVLRRKSCRLKVPGIFFELLRLCNDHHSQCTRRK